MKVIQLKCPACGATFDISEDRTNFFCQYCGTKLHLDDESKTIHINHRIDHKIEQTIRNVDEAAVREADAKTPPTLNKPFPPIFKSRNITFSSSSPDEPRCKYFVLSSPKTSRDIR